MFSIENQYTARPESSIAWVTDSTSAPIRNGCSLLAVVSLITTLLFHSPVCAMPGFLAIGFFCGCLAKKDLTKYNFVAIFLFSAYLMEERNKRLRLEVVAVVFIASTIFPYVAAIAATVCGVYCGLSYAQKGCS